MPSRNSCGQRRGSRRCYGELHLVGTSPILSCDRYVGDQGPGRIRILRDTMTTGRYFAAKPRSAIQTSPGRGFIDQVQDFLLHFARPSDVKEALIGQLDEFDDLASNLFRSFWAPFLELFVEPFRQHVHSVPPSGNVAEL